MTKQTVPDVLTVEITVRCDEAAAFVDYMLLRAANGELSTPSPLDSPVKRLAVAILGNSDFKQWQALKAKPHCKRGATGCRVR